MPVDSKDKDALKTGTEHIMELDDGFNVVKLSTPKASDKEFEYMGLRVYEGSYEDGVKNKTVQAYSLRDQDGNPVAHMEVEDGKITRCNGVNNGKILAHHIPYVQKFIKEQNLDPSEVCGYVFLCKDVNNNFYDIRNIPENTVFERLNLYGCPANEISDSISTCKVMDPSCCRIGHGLRRDINGNVQNVLKPSEGAVFQDLDMSFLDFREFPASLATCTVKGNLNLSGDGPDSLNTLKNCPKVEGEIDVSYRIFIESLEGIPEGVKKVICTGCPIKIIPEHIPDDAIEGLNKGQIAMGKARWRAKHSNKIKDKFAPLTCKIKNTVSR